MKKKTSIRGCGEHAGHLDENEMALFAEYLRGETGDIPNALVSHVESCRRCRTELMNIADLLDDIGDQAGDTAGAETAMPAAIQRRPWLTIRHLLRTAAAVAAVIVLAWAIEQLLPDRKNREPETALSKQDSLLKAHSAGSLPPAGGQHVAVTGSVSDSSQRIDSSGSARYAEAFVPNPLYESLVQAAVRPGQDPRVTGPDPAIIFFRGDTLKLAWTPDPTDRYRVIILDNKARQAREIDAGGGPTLTWVIDLDPGLYYWKFQDREELWKVGRLTVMAGAHPSKQ